MGKYAIETRKTFEEMLDRFRLKYLISSLVFEQISRCVILLRYSALFISDFLQATGFGHGLFLAESLVSWPGPSIFIS